MKKEGNEVEVIDYQPDYMREPNLWYIPSSVKELVKLFVRFPERLCSVKRHKIYSEFSKKYIPLTKVYNNINELRNDPPIADIYLAGSDQIWNPTFRNGTDPAYYLDFGPENVQRKSFSASFAVSSIENIHKK